MAHEKVSDDTRKTKEHIKEGQHKNDIIKAVGGAAASGGAVGIAHVVATVPVAGEVLGAKIGSLIIGGPVGALLVDLGVPAAIGAAGTSVLAPVFFGIALPAIGIFAGAVMLQNHKANKLLKEFATDANIDSLGEKIAEGVFLPVIYFLKSLNLETEKIKEYLLKEMKKDYGFAEEYANRFLEKNLELSLKELSKKIKNQDVSITITDLNGKKKKTNDLKLSFLHGKALDLCKTSVNKAIFEIDEKKRERAKETISYMKKELFKKKPQGKVGGALSKIKD